MVRTIIMKIITKRARQIKMRQWYKNCGVTRMCGLSTRASKKQRMEPVSRCMRKSAMVRKNQNQFPVFVGLDWKGTTFDSAGTTQTHVKKHGHCNWAFCSRGKPHYTCCLVTKTRTCSAFPPSHLTCSLLPPTMNFALTPHFYLLLSSTHFF